MAETIVRLGGRGEGVTASGRHVALAAPGDRVGTDGALVRGPHHADPPCRHFPECGGCQLQHVDEAAYARFLLERIGAALASHGLSEPTLRPAHISPPCSRRRAALAAERRGRRILIGFRAQASHRIVDMHECHVLRPELFALVAPLRALLSTLSLGHRTAGVRMTLADQGVDMMLEGVSADGLEAVEALTHFAGRFGLARLAVDSGDGAEVRWEPEPATVTLGGVRVPLPPKSFLQATPQGEAALIAAVREAVGPARAVADLFAGLGTFALALEGRVLAVEGDRDAALALKAGAARAQRPLRTEHRDLFRRPLDARELRGLDAVVLDPPRAGAREQIAELAGSTVPRIAYVSCNPATFARDAAILAGGGYRLEWVQPVGQFRWSTHVELVGAFAFAADRKEDG